MKNVLQLDKLTKTYNSSITALKGISLEIEKGDVVGYLGPNGAGKTTTMKVLTNLVKPTSGHAYINGIDVNKNPKEALRRIGTLIEVPGVYDYLTPHEMLKYFGNVYRLDSKQIDQRIAEVLKLLNLKGWAHKRIGIFSTGMKRRLTIAKAILHQPEILILDEPVLGLDPEGMNDIRELIRRLHDQGVTIFMSSHLLKEVEDTCNIVILLDKGKVVASESVENIRKRTGKSMIKARFLTPLSREDIDGIQTIELIERFEIVEGIGTIHFDGEPSTSAQILSRLVSLGLSVVTYEIVSDHLEDFYLAVMGKRKRVK